MNSYRIERAALAGSLILGLGLASLSAGAGASQPDAGPLRCQIEETRSGDMMTLQGVVRSDIAVSGSYRFQVVGRSGGGSANISQSGGFTAGPGSEARLGQVTLGSSGVYDIRLDITANGLHAACTGPGSAT